MLRILPCKPESLTYMLIALKSVRIGMILLVLTTNTLPIKIKFFPDIDLDLSYGKGL